MGKDTTNLREVIGRALESAGWLNCDPDDWAELCNSLAAKDREIAELRARPTTEFLSELMRGLELPPDCLTLKPAAMYSIGLAIADQAKRCLVAERERDEWRDKFHASEIEGHGTQVLCDERTAERDEARECVGRLYSALRLAMSRSAHNSECDRIKSSFDEYDHSPQKECSCHISTMGAALATTPEHLRK
jgi:hypothetical protein